MSGPGVGSSPNWAFAALSARWRSAGGTTEASELNEIEQFIADGDDENLTAALDRRCRALEGMGLVKVDKVSLDTVTDYKVGDDLTNDVQKLTRGALKVCSEQARY